MGQTHRFSVLDSFRGLCALSVVLFHLHIPHTMTELNFFRNAHLFVEFFFVLSGFVLFHTYKNTLNNYQDLYPFIIKRLVRLYPLHFFMLTLFLLLECGKWFAEMKGLNFNGHAFTGRNSPQEIFPNLLLLQSWLNQVEPLSFNGPSWSISAELYVYIIFATLCIFTRQFSIYIFAILSGISFFSLALNVDVLNNNILRVCSCFFSGALIYHIYQKIVTLPWPKYVATLLEGFSLILIFFILNWNITYQNLVASLLFCMVILVFSVERGFFSLLFNHLFFKTLGTLSYSIYMIHFALIFLLISATMIISKLTAHDFAPMLREPQTNDLIRYITTHSTWGNNILVCLILATIIGLAHLSWTFIEKPGISWGKRFLLRYKKNAMETGTSIIDSAP